MQKNSIRQPVHAETDLVTAAQSGSREAFDELFRRSSSRLYRAAAAMLNSREEVEDVLQTAACNAYLNVARFRRASSFNTWLTSIVVNQARMRRRELRRATLLSIDEPLAGTLRFPQFASCVLTPEDDVQGRELLRILHQEIHRLPAPLRQIILVYLENLSMVEAAERVGVSTAAAKTRLFRAKRELRDRMRRYRKIPAAA